MTERKIFIAALQQVDPAQRQAYLNEACAGQPELRQQVEYLLRLHEGAGSFLDKPADSASGPLPQPAEQGSLEAPGTLIGPYKLLEPIGEGGFGAVYMAEQQQPVRRKVALKVLKPGMDTRQVVARFEAERQALALMDHPNIAKVFDGGATAGGRPYFVMELVKGVPITDFGDHNQLTPRQRLELFVPVCHAVQHAHQKGLIHRDLKPSNILVVMHDATPVPKVIDFGIAKALGQELTDKTLFTGFAQMIGTPLYMSPEQAGQSGLDIDTRSDIYSLGVLLYELLTGTTPFTKERFKEAGYDEIRRIIREEEPPKPSTRLSTLALAVTTEAAQCVSDPRRLSQLCRGELDWVVMKCLEKDRNRRYETADALARDIECYLRDEPVRACPPSSWYRFRKFARRNRGAFSIGATLFVAALATVVALAVGLVAVEKQRQKTEQAYHEEARRRLQAREALDGMTSLLVEDFLAKQTVLTEDHKVFLRQALEQYEEFAAETGQDQASRHGVARAYRNAGRIRRRLAQAPDAEALFRLAADRYARLADDFPDNPLYRQELAACHSDRGNALSEMSRAHEALTAYGDALAVQNPLVVDYPAVAAYRAELVRTHVNRASSLIHLDQLPEAEAALRAALALGQQLQRESPKVAAYREGLARSLAELGRVLTMRGGRDKESEAAVRDGMALMRGLADEFPIVPVYRHLLAMSHINLANRLRNAGRPREVEAGYRDAIVVFRQLASDFPSEPKYRHGLAIGLMNIGVFYFNGRRHEESAAAYDEALGLIRRLAADSPGEPDYRSLLGTIHINRGELLAGTDRPQEAERAFAEALAERMKLVEAFPTNGAFHHGLANTLRNLAVMRRKQKDFAGAREALEQAGPHHEAALKGSSPSPACRIAYRDNRRELAANLLELGEYVKAAAAAEQMVQLFVDPGTDHYDAACVVARGATAATHDQRLAPDQRKAQAQAYAARAVLLLSRAVEKFPALRERMQKDRALDSLRQRPDFEALRARVPAQSPG
jgi:serine/threonine protein kinase/tetratricopeptide (TPR) repeat protein